MAGGGLARVGRAMVPALVAAAVALAFDVANRHTPFSILATGFLDECAHLATTVLGLLVLGGVVPLRTRFVVSACVATVAVDLDHVPAFLGLVGGHGRPFTHSLATVLVLVLAAWLVPRHRQVLAGAATGLVLHLARDVAEGLPGVPLLWPLDGHAFVAGGGTFLVLVAVLLVLRLVLVLRPLRRGGPGPSDLRRGDGSAHTSRPR